MRVLVIYGAGGHGRETAWLVQQINAVWPQWHLLGFLDDHGGLRGHAVAGHPVIGGREAIAPLLTRFGRIAVALGVGAPSAKRAIVAALPTACSLATLVHPEVRLAPDVVVGNGSQVHAGTLVTVNVRIGRAVTINRRVDLSHDVQVGDFATLAPSVSLAGNVRVGEAADLGIRATCIPGVQIGNEARVGAGAVVIRDVPAGSTVAGVPARPLPPRQPLPPAP